MPLNVTIEKPAGNTVYDYQFMPGDQIRVKVSDAETFFAMGASADVIIIFADGSQSLHASHNLDWVGNASFDFILPSSNTTGTITVTLTSIAKQAQQILHIGIGEPGLNPTPPPADQNLITEIETILKWVAIGAGVVGVAYLASKALPSITEGIAKSKKKA